ncbi:AHH domain-containing protein [Flavobacterium azooxidireducens]|uniref:AHH domain-containing protein n=1 Tax=Flavobacterium azooxidireducens TaxID=1871076 RepID=A0ABY4KJX4_9FLAO|nr:AHH domain-containing protein [Flavobacterium azooxidireducens]UPQ80068.1 AHH domain-containing protein [Flavobacterium azooxidireducens]
MKNNFNLLLGIIATFLLFISCDKDFYEDVELQKNNLESIDVKTITYDEFKRKLKSLENKPAVKMIMNNTNSIRHFARSGDDSEIEIFTDVIKEITSGTYKSYTMYIKTSDTIASKFYNLTLEEKEGNTAAFITKYSPTENWLNDKNQPFDGGITTFRVEPGPSGSIKFTHFDEGGGGTSYPPYCDGVVVATTVFTEVLCGCGHTWQDYLMNLCTGCTTGYPSFPSFAQSTLYECISTPGSGYSPAGGSSPGSSQPGEPSNNSLTTIVGVPDMPRVSYLTEPLSLDARQNDYLVDNPDVEYQLGSFIDQNTINDLIDPAAMTFAQELIKTLEEFNSENEDTSLLLDVTKSTIYAFNNGYFTQPLDDGFFNYIDDYSSLAYTDPNTAINFARMFVAHCAVIKQENPTWSHVKVFARAYVDTVQLLLDFAGLVPAIGEVADLANGTIYLIQGDGVNASLSYASAIPVAGWFSAGVKFAKRADGLKYLVKGTNNLITFGAYNSKKFRQACGIATGDATKQAHHLIPRGSQIIEHEVVQRAAKATNNGGFHIDQALNGVAVATWRNQPNHPNYNNKIYTKLQNYIQQNPSATPTQCYNQLMVILNQAKQAVINNPNTHLNDLVF